MVLDVNVCKVTVTAVFVLASHVVAHNVAIFDLSFVENFGVGVEETPVLHRQVRHWITAMSYTSLEVPSSSILLVEPNSKFGVSDTRTSIVVEISDLVLVGKEMRSNVSGNRSSETVPSHAD